MSDVLAVFGSLLILAVTFPAMLLVLWLAFPATVARARRRVDTTPGRCFGLGVLTVIILAVPIGILLAIPAGPVRLVGFLAIVAVVVVSLIGQAGIAAALGVRMLGRTDRSASPLVAFLGGALSLELASGLPVIGWFLVTPIVMVAGLGAAVFAATRREPMRKPQPSMPSTTATSAAGAGASTTP